MKNFIFILLAFLIAFLFDCTRPATVIKTDYLKLADSIEVLKAQNKTNASLIQTLQDSIAELKQHPLMTSEQFIQLYKYGRLNKYFLICKKNPTQWKYYKGWSIRVFEQ